MNRHAFVLAAAFALSMGLIVASVLFSSTGGCQPEKEATVYATPCGMSVVSGFGLEAPSRAQLEAFEAKAVSIGLVRCEALQGWRLKAAISSIWEPGTVSSAGCYNRIAYISNQSAGIAKSGYAHAMAHINECPRENMGHVGWDDIPSGASVFERINILNGDM